MKSFFYISIAIILFSLNSIKAEIQFQFSIDKQLNQEIDQTQKDKIIKKVSELSYFLNNDVLKNIPQQTQKKLNNNIIIKIKLSNESMRDGLFVPDIENHEHKIIMQLNQIFNNGIKSLLVHEIYHAIHFELNPDEEPWIREGLAQLFEYIVTKEFNGVNLNASFTTPSTPLIGNYNIENANPAQYGHNLLYFYYLYNRCGGDQFFWSLTEGDSNLKGTSLINYLLQNNKTSSIECSSFEQSAISFEVAKLHNQNQFQNEKEMNRFFLIPLTIPTKKISITSNNDFELLIKNMPLYSSIKLDLSSWQKFNTNQSNYISFYANKNYPYDVSDNKPQVLQKTHEIIIVKIK